MNHNRNYKKKAHYLFPQKKKVPKSELELIKLDIKKLALWPWLIHKKKILKPIENNLVSKEGLQTRIKEIINAFAPSYLDRNDPIASSIIDTSHPHPWFRNSFTDEEWAIISDTKSCIINNGNEIISEININEMKNHL
ncbi:16662_t:CDS:2 [Entrophospora sp. SA101]|nr:16662_t:CDS:2 [Entrophospora sp. SA101]CAJ0884871.1 7906_t:CDS:2 [Entrophospora sp. SA101]